MKSEIKNLIAQFDKAATLVKELSVAMASSRALEEYAVILQSKRHEIALTEEFYGNSLTGMMISTQSKQDIVEWVNNFNGEQHGRTDFVTYKGLSLRFQSRTNWKKGGSIIAELV